MLAKQHFSGVSDQHVANAWKRLERAQERKNKGMRPLIPRMPQIAARVVETGDQVALGEVSPEDGTPADAFLPVIECDAGDREPIVDPFWEDGTDIWFVLFDN
jgi:hypothetical protein